MNGAQWIGWLKLSLAASVIIERLSARRAKGVVMVAPVEVDESGVGLLVRNGLLKQDQTDDRNAVGEACLTALEQWAGGRGARSTGQS